MKIAVLGAGAMGSVFGGRLARAGLDVRLVDVNRAHIEAVSQGGLTLEDDAGSAVVKVPIGLAEAFTDPVDLLIVFTKGPQTVEALRSATAIIGPATHVLTLQNGLGAGERVSEVVAPERVLFGMTNWPADFRAPGKVASHGAGEVQLWSLGGTRSEGLTAAYDALETAGLNARLNPEVLIAIWEKATFNAAMNSISAITGFTVGEMADDPDLRALAFAVVDEAVSVAKARGHAVSRDRIAGAVEHAFADHRSHKPSMLQDVLARRRTEIESINGAIAREAALAGIAAPVIETLARLVRAKERTF